MSDVILNPDPRIANLCLIADQMIREQRERGDYWIEVPGLEDRSQSWNAVIITDSPNRCLRLTYHNGDWQKYADTLTDVELGEFFAAFGSHWAVLLNSWIGAPEPVRVRAFIKNGRKRGGFSISLDMTDVLRKDRAA